MPEPTGITPNDYATMKKEQLAELLIQRDAMLRSLGDELHAIKTEQARQEKIALERLAERRIAREERGTPKLLGKIDVFDIDDPDDVLARAQAIRAGHVPLGMAKRFKTNAHIRAPKGSKLAKRLGAREDQAPDVPLRTEFDRDEMPAESLEHFHKSGAILAIA